MTSTENMLDFIRAWEVYEERKKALNCLDYGDLNRIALNFLNTYGSAELNDTYTHIIVDEFQDTNYVQFELIKHLTAKREKYHSCCGCKPEHLRLSGSILKQY